MLGLAPSANVLIYWHYCCVLVPSSAGVGVSTRSSTFRAPVCSTRLGATADQPEGHALREPQDANTSTSTIDSSANAESSTAQESQSSVATLDTPVAAAPPAADSAEGRSSAVSGEGGAEQAPTMAAVGQEVDTATVGGGQSTQEEEEKVMAELLAQQPGGQEKEGAQGDDGAPKAMVSAGLFVPSLLRVLSSFQLPRASLVGANYV